MIDFKEELALVDRLHRSGKSAVETEAAFEIEKLVKTLQIYGQGWILAEKQLPKEDGSTLICTAMGKVCTARFYTATAKWNGNAGKSIKWWMPLPKAPKEGS